MPITFDSSGFAPQEGSSDSSWSVDITSASVGADCYCWKAVDEPSATMTLTGWTLLGTIATASTATAALFYRRKQSGDTTFSGTQPAGRGVHGWVAYTGTDGHEATGAGNFAFKNSSSTTISTPSVLESGGDSWAVGFFLMRTSTSARKNITWTPPGGMVERVDANNQGASSGPWLGVELVDSAGAVTAGAHSYTATASGSESHGAAALIYLAPAAASSGGSGSASSTWGFTGTASGPVTLPGSIDGVEPEGQGRNPALMAPNGALYRVMESSLATGNRPMMMKSTNGGATWTEVDSGNRPTANDLEAVWVELDGSTLVVTINRDSTVWWCEFDTATDTWGTQETVDSGLVGSGVEQSVAHVKTSNGQWWVFYSDTGSTQQLSYRRRTGTNTYSAKVSGAFGSTSTNLAGVFAAVGDGDVTHIVYTDTTNHHAYRRTLTTGGTLSAAEQIDTAGTYNFSSSYADLALTNLGIYTSGGTEVISVAYADTSGQLQLVQWVGGVKQSPVQLSTAAVLTSPGATTSDSIVAHLAVHGTTVHVVWADEATGDVLHASKPHGQAATAPETLWASGTNVAYYVYCSVHTYPGDRTVLGYVYDVGDHANDVSFIRYDEIELTIAPGSGTASDAWSFAGSAAGRRSPRGTSSGSWGFTGAAFGKRVAAGSSASTWGYAGSASGTRPAKGTASGGFAFTGSASGAAVHRGAASGGFGYAGLAEGRRAPQGAASAAWGFSGTATGATTRRGVAGGSWGFSGAADGSAPTVGISDGTASGTFGWTGTAEGKRTAKGTAAGSFSWAGAATGTAPAVEAKQGAATGTWGFTGTAAGKLVAAGTAGGVWAYTGAASGRTPTSTGDRRDFTVTVGPTRTGWIIGTTRTRPVVDVAQTRAVPLAVVGPTRTDRQE